MENINSKKRDGKYIFRSIQHGMVLLHCWTNCRKISYEGVKPDDHKCGLFYYNQECRFYIFVHKQVSIIGCSNVIFCDESVLLLGLMEFMCHFGPKYVLF